MKTIKMKYTGKMAVTVPGVLPVTGKKRIEPGDTVEVPEEIALNLSLDRFWEIVEEKPAPHPTRERKTRTPEKEPEEPEEKE